MPKVTFRATFLTEELSIDVEEGQTILEAAEAAGVPMGDACGGNCGCSTCHVHVEFGFESLEEMDDPEDDILGRADDVKYTSRLGCQAEVGSEDLVIKVTRESQLTFINEHPKYRGRTDEVVN